MSQLLLNILYYERYFYNMMIFLYFLISIIASTIGAISGVGGGVIIKPVLDATGTLPVSTISFLSGCTVLSMSTVSLIRGRKSNTDTNENSTPIDLKRITLLAIGSAFGGILGNNIFNFVKNMFSSENIVGTAQSILLLIITILVFIYVSKKDTFKTYNVQNKFACLSIGLMLGVLSAFLGIGGGPINIAVLYLLFSMDTKTAVKNSLFIIFFSQLASLLTTLVTHTVPDFNPYILLVMIIGGISGGIIGGITSKKCSKKVSQTVFIALLFFIIIICIYNIIGYLN